MVRSCKVASMQGVHTCTGVERNLCPLPNLRNASEAQPLRFPKPAQRSSCGAFHTWKRNLLPFPKPAQRSKWGGAFPKPSQRSKRAALSIGKRNLRPFPKPSPLPNLRTADGSAGLGRSSTRAVVGATRVGVLEGFAFASRGRILAKSQKCQKRDIVDSQSTHEGELSPLAGKTGPFLLHEG
jgi:hypothetical protein